LASAESSFSQTLFGNSPARRTQYLPNIIRSHNYSHVPLHLATISTGNASELFSIITRWQTTNVCLPTARKLDRQKPTIYKSALKKNVKIISGAAYLKVTIELH
jgi:hypothetical protein